MTILDTIRVLGGDFRYLQGYAEATVRAFVLLLTDEEYRRYISEARYPSKDL